MNKSTFAMPVPQMRSCIHLEESVYKDFPEWARSNRWLLLEKLSMVEIWISPSGIVVEVNVNNEREIKK